MSSIYENPAEFELTGDVESVDAEPLDRARPSRYRSLLVWGTALLTLFFVTQILQLFPAVGRFQVAKITVLIVAVVFISSREGITSRVRINAAPQLKYAMGILLLAIITIPFSLWPSNSIGFIVEVFAKNIVFVYLLVQAVRSDRDARVVAFALVAGCAMVVLAMLTNLGPEVKIAEDERLNVAGTYDANDLALLFVVALPYAFFMLRGSRLFQQILLIAAIGLMLVGIVKTGSRGGFLGLIVIGVLMFLRGSKQARKYTLITTIVGISLFAFAAPTSYWNRISTIFDYEKDYNARAEEGRFAIWRTGLEMFAARPLTGVGIYCFSIGHSKFGETRLQMSPHNSIIQITAELGIGGLALFALIVWTSLASTRRIRRRAREDLAPENLIWLASAVEISFIGFLVSAFFLTHAYSAIFCFLAGMSAALFARYEGDQRQRLDAEGEIEYA